MQDLPFTVVEGSRPRGRPECLPVNVESDNGREWQTYDQHGYIILRLQAQAILSHIELQNKGMSLIDVQLGMKDKKNSFVAVRTAVRLPMNRRVEVKTGYLPTQYVK